MSRFKILLFLGIWSLTTTFSDLIAASSITISGSYLDKQSQSISNAHVYLIEFSDTLARSISNINGEFTLTYETVGITNDSESDIPASFFLSQNYPNPFNPSTRFELHIMESGLLCIYDIAGHLIDYTNLKYPGSYSIEWGGLNRNNYPVSAGLYLYNFRTKTKTFSKKMILLDGSSGNGRLRILGGKQNNNSVNMRPLCKNSDLTTSETELTLILLKENTSHTSSLLIFFTAT